jgi:hypothetical protein
MVSGCALLIDYVLTITISIASGADALFSFFPSAWLPFKMAVAVTGVLLLTWLNMRGIKESVLPLVPIVLIFLVAHAFAIVYAACGPIPGNTAIVSSTAPYEQGAPPPKSGAWEWGSSCFALQHGGGHLYRIEESATDPIMRDPKGKTAIHTMRYMSFRWRSWSSASIVAYLLIMCTMSRKRLQPYSFKMTEAGMRTGADLVWFRFIPRRSAVRAAQTDSLTGRDLSNMALDRWPPSRFAALNDLLVTQNGVIIMAPPSLFRMLYSAGSVRFLVVLYSINVIVTFSLRSWGWCARWWNAPP